MTRKKLAQHLLLPCLKENFTWSLYHENSKNSVYELPRTDEDFRKRTATLAETLDFEGYPLIDLPAPDPLVEIPLSQAIVIRESALALEKRKLELSLLGTLFHFGYGINRDRTPLAPNRRFRMIPSAGALYPLEIFFYTDSVPDLEPGLYHYNPARHGVRCLRSGNLDKAIVKLLVQPELAKGASLLIFISAVFQRSIMKYGERGYRFILLEAGHLAQNLGLLATGFGLGCVTIGGFFDRLVDDFLELDGVTHSSIYLLGLGKRKNSQPDSKNYQKKSEEVPWLK